MDFDYWIPLELVVVEYTTQCTIPVGWAWTWAVHPTIETYPPETSR